ALHVRAAADDAPGAAGAGHDRDVLDAVDLVTDRRGEDAGLDVRRPELLAGAGIERRELTRARPLEHEPAGGRERAAVRRTRALDAPHLALRDGIPCAQPAVRAREHVARVEHRVRAEIDALVRRHAPRLEALGVAPHERRAVDRQIDEPGLR